MTELSSDQMLAMIAQLQADNAKLKADAAMPSRKITMKVSDKGAISVYGLGRFPFTFYRTQAERLFAPDTVKQMQDFIKANDTLLTVKA